MPKYGVMTSIRNQQVAGSNPASSSKKRTVKAVLFCYCDGENRVRARAKPDALRTKLKNSDNNAQNPRQ